MDRITPCLWFDTEAEEAAQFYTSVFPNSRIVRVTHYGSAGPRPEGMVMEVEFELDGRSVLALNGGPEFRFTEAISLQADCKVDFVLSGEIPWRDKRWRRRPRCTWAAPGHRWRWPNGRWPRAGTPSGRWCWRRCRTWPIPPASTRRPPAVVDVRPRAGGSSVDMTEKVTEVFERFAPGFRDVVVAARAVPAAEMRRPQRQPGRRRHRRRRGNNMFGAITGPSLRLNPWTTPIPQAYLCSSATPPGGGVHGMAGYYAARTMLRREFGIKKLPRLSP